MRPLGGPPGIQSIDIGHALLEALAEGGRPMALSELASATGMTSSKARGYLVSFMRVALVRQLPGSTLYDLGSGALRLGLAALSRVDPIRLARERLPELSRTLGQTATLVVWGRDAPIVIDKVDGPNYFPFALKLGASTPLLSSAAGRVFIAHLPKALWSAEAKRERQTNFLGAKEAPDLATIRQELLSEGVCRMRELVLKHYSAIAGPIFDANGALAGVVNVVCPTSNFESMETLASDSIRGFAHLTRSET